MIRCAAFGALVAVVVSATGLGAGHADAIAPGDACLPSLVGTWRSESPTESGFRFLEFTSSGWASLLDVDRLGEPPAFEVVAQVPFQLIASPALRIEFTTARGNDRFPPGRSSWSILAYDDLSFIARDRQSPADTRWVRVLTRRYFITIAARGDADGNETAFAMWTTVDGRRIASEALGQAVVGGGNGKAHWRFGKIPAGLTDYFTHDRNREREPMLRLELNEAEYHRTLAVMKGWEERIRREPPNETASAQLAAEFLADAAVSLNQCASRLAVDGRASPTLLQFVAGLRSLNDWRHVADDQFPFVWEPPPIN